MSKIFNFRFYKRHCCFENNVVFPLLDMPSLAISCALLGTATWLLEYTIAKILNSFHFCFVENLKCKNFNAVGYCLSVGDRRY